MIRLFDWLNQDSVDLHFSLEEAGFHGVTVLINDDGCLPDGVTSPYSFFCEMETGNKKPLYFNRLQVPEYWQITGTNTKGEIWNYSEKKADIYYHEPKHLRLVKTVDWLDTSGKVAWSDHYNQYGWLFAQTHFDDQQRAVMRTYLNQQGQEVLTEYLLTGDSLLNWQGGTYYFKKKVDFFHFYFQQAGLDTSRIWYNSLGLPFLISYYLQEDGQDILFWQEGIKEEIPGNMKLILSNRTRRTRKVIVQQAPAYQKLLSLVNEEEKESLAYLGYMYPVQRENQGRKEVLILTNSDQLEGFETIVKGLPDYTFHIGALTEMSQRLYAFDSYEQVRLYPNIGAGKIEQLFANCDVYLDINHGSEIVNSIRRAFENNLLILGFANTVHHRNMVMEEGIFDQQHPDSLVAYLQDGPSIQDRVYIQRFQTGQASAEDYQTILFEN